MKSKFDRLQLWQQCASSTYIIHHYNIWNIIHYQNSEINPNVKSITEDHLMSRKFSIGLANIFCSVTEQQKYSQYSRLSKISLQSCEGKKLQVQLSSIRLLCSSSHGHKKFWITARKGVKCVVLVSVIIIITLSQQSLGHLATHCVYL